MQMLDLVQLNLLSPVVLAFVLGMIATLVRSDLRFPDELYIFLSIYLLLAIGLKGGVELSRTSPAQVWAPILVTLLLGVTTPVTSYAVLRKLGRFSVADSAALAAHYGSVSVVTFIAALAFLDSAGVSYERYLPTLVAILEIPAIVVALVIARVRMGGKTAWAEVFHEILSGRSILLLLGGLLIGLIVGPDRFQSVAPFFVTPFHGILMLFLLEMGMVTARRLRDLRKVGLFLIAFGILIPLLHGTLGIILGHFVGMSLGGSMMLGVLAASASYIAAPAAVRIALPEANPSYYLTAALGITFPFNLTVGIPLYYAMAKYLFAD
jgi:uncharacterized protein